MVVYVDANGRARDPLIGSLAHDELRLSAVPSATRSATMLVARFVVARWGLGADLTDAAEAVARRIVTATVEATRPDTDSPEGSLLDTYRAAQTTLAFRVILHVHHILVDAWAATVRAASYGDLPHPSQTYTVYGDDRQPCGQGAWCGVSTGDASRTLAAVAAARRPERATPGQSAAHDADHARELEPCMTNRSTGEPI